MNIYFNDLSTNKACDIYIYIYIYIALACEKYFTMLQEIVYTITSEYLYTIYLTWLLQCKNKREGVEKISLVVNCHPP